MSNGNNNTETSPLSKHVRPTVAWASFIVYCIAMFQLLSPLIADKAWVPITVLLGIPAGFVGWYFGVRNQEKNQEKLTSGIASAVVAGIKTSVSAPATQPEPQSQSQPAVEPAPQPEPEAQPSSVPLPPLTLVQFAPEKEQFEAELPEAARGVYGVVNDATLFYEAWTRGTTRFNRKDTDWAAFLDRLGNRYFSSIWGLYRRDENGNVLVDSEGKPELVEEDALAYASEHLNDRLGCSTCQIPPGCTFTDLAFKADKMGEAYYTSYRWMLDLRRYLDGKFFPWQQQ